MLNSEVTEKSTCRKKFKFRRDWWIPLPVGFIQKHGLKKHRKT